MHLLKFFIAKYTARCLGYIVARCYESICSGNSVGDFNQYRDQQSKQFLGRCHWISGYTGSTSFSTIMFLLIPSFDTHNQHFHNIIMSRCELNAKASYLKQIKLIITSPHVSLSNETVVIHPSSVSSRKGARATSAESHAALSISLLYPKGHVSLTLVKTKKKKKEVLDSNYENISQRSF